MARLPNPGSDSSNWGALLNDFLRVGHHEDGSLRGTYTVANVLDFGAVGKATGDDIKPVAIKNTAAIQGAIASLTEGGVVFFPPGVYYLNDTINVPNHSVANPNDPNHYGITLQGSGPFASILNNISTGPAIQSATGGTIEVSMTVADLGITGQNNQDGIYLLYTYFSHFRNLFIRNCRNGIYVSKGFYNTFDHVICYQNIESGFKIGAVGNGNTFLSCTSKSNTGHGFQFTSECDPGKCDTGECCVDRLHGCSVFGGVVEGNSGNDFIIDNADSIRIIGVYVEGDKAAASINISNNSNYCVVSDCNLEKSQNLTSIAIGESKGTYIEGCTVYGNITIDTTASGCIIGLNPLIAGGIVDNGQGTISYYNLKP